MAEQLEARVKAREGLVAVLGNDSATLQNSGILEQVEQVFAEGKEAEGRSDVAKIYERAIFCLLDLSNTIPVRLLPELISFMEKNEETIRLGISPVQSFHPRKLALLSVSKRIMSRLCPTKDNALIGRIMMLLARLFYLYDRSGLNLQGEINSTDVVVQAEAESDAGDEGLLDTGDAEQVKDAAEALAVAPESTRTTYDFYRTFWQFQVHFSKPPIPHISESWSTFCKELEVLLTELDNFAGFPAAAMRAGSAEAGDEPPSKIRRLDGGSADPSDDVLHAERHVTLPKYLTSRKLMNLQLRDGTFRRDFMVQTLILLSSLTGYYAQIKDAATTAFFVADNIAKLDALTARVWQSLRRIPPFGDKFAEAIKSALQREQHWRQWKLEKCPNVSKQAVVVPDTKHSDGGAKKTPRAILGLVTAMRKASTATVSKTALTHQAFMEEFSMQLYPDSGVEAEYYLSKNRNFYWRCSRSLARHHLAVARFDHFQPLEKIMESIDPVLQKAADERKKERKEGDTKTDEKPVAESEA